MRTAGLYDQAAAAAERVIREHGISTLPVDPMAIARSVGIEVKEKPASSGGVSGVLIRLGDEFCIAYATHIRSPGSGASALPTSLDTISLRATLKRFSRTAPCAKSAHGFLSNLKYELEADHFAARLLMPNALFYAALRDVGDGLPQSRASPTTCCASLPGTAIRYAECVPEPVAIVVSTGNSVDYCAMSRALENLDDID